MLRGFVGRYGARAIKRPAARANSVWCPRYELNVRQTVQEWKRGVFEKTRCFKWFPRFLFEYRGLETFQQLY